ncbi:MAG: hypothetical protein M3072_00960 [Candidatus Dormibacteraeota bacterium]|nr:hypothetical protein [Candidatus Dormibacteraeota bacterium]
MSRLIAAGTALAGLVLLGVNVSRGAGGGRLVAELLALVCLTWVLLRASGIQLPAAVLVLPITLVLLPLARVVFGTFDCELPQSQQPRYGGVDWRGRPIRGWSAGAAEKTAAPVRQLQREPLQEIGS